MPYQNALLRIDLDLETVRYLTLTDPQWISQGFRETREKGLDENRLDITPTRYTPRSWCHKRGSFGSSSI